MSFIIGKYENKSWFKVGWKIVDKIIWVILWPRRQNEIAYYIQQIEIDSNLFGSWMNIVLSTLFAVFIE